MSSEVQIEQLWTSLGPPVLEGTGELGGGGPSEHVCTGPSGGHVGTLPIDRQTDWQKDITFATPLVGSNDMIH